MNAYELSYGQIALIVFVIVLAVTIFYWILKKFINGFFRILTVIVITVLIMEADLDKEHKKEPINVQLALASKRLLTGNAYFFKQEKKKQKKALPWVLKKII